MQRILLLLFCFGFYVSIHAQDEVGDTTSFFKNTLEVSFGQSLLFISNSKAINIKQQEAIVVPTSSLLFFAELRTLKKIKFPVFLNYPTEAKQFIVNGQLVSEKANPNFGAGIGFRVFKFKTGETTGCEFEVGSLLSVTTDLKNRARFVPILVSRFRIIKASSFVMYMGLSYSFGLNSIGLLYGSGTIF